MGREIKRVPIDFDWPLEQTWEGYLLPERLSQPDCTECAGRGETPAALWLRAAVHMILMLEDDLTAQEQGRAMHPYFQEFRSDGWGTRPSADISDVIKGLLGDRYRGHGWLGHDAIDGWTATNTIVEAAGLDSETWGRCIACGGHGATEAYPGQRAHAEAWERTEPPTGDGWQVWETVSDGSPITPVFPTAEALAQHMATARPWHYSGDYDTALRFIKAGWAPSMVVTPGKGIQSGVEWVGEQP